MDKRGIAKRTLALIIVAIIIIVAILGVLVYVYIVPKEVEEVRFGNLVSLTGAQAAFGEPAAWAIRKCIEDVNKLGGLNVGGRKLQVKLIQYDDSTDPSKAAVLAEQLILQDKVHLIITCPGPPTIHIPVSQIADKHKIPAMVDGVFEPWWSAGPYKYAWCFSCFLITPFPESDPRHGQPGYQALLGYLEFTNLFRDKHNGKIALFAPDDADGRPFYDLMAGVLQEAGYTVVGVEKRLGQYAPGTMDFTAIVREWKEGQAEVLIGLSIGADFATMWRQAHALDWKPKMGMDGRALKNLADVEAIGGDLAIGLADPFNIWCPGRPWKSYYGGRTNQQLAEEWTKETGKPWSDSLSAYSWAEIACRVIEQAGSLDPEKINQALSKLDVETMAFGRVTCITELHFNPFKTVVVQWVKTPEGKLSAEVTYSVHPEIPTTHELIFPLP